MQEGQMTDYGITGVGDDTVRESITINKLN